MDQGQRQGHSVHIESCLCFAVLVNMHSHAPTSTSLTNTTSQYSSRNLMDMFSLTREVMSNQYCRIV